MNLETLEPHYRRLDAALTDLFRQSDMLTLVAQAAPDPTFDEETGKPSNLAAEIQVACRLVNDSLTEAQTVLFRLLQRFAAPANRPEVEG